MFSQLESFFAEQRRKFPSLVEGEAGRVVHLNNAAGSEMPRQAIEGMRSWLLSNFVNEGKIFPRLSKSKHLVEEAREATADLIGASPSEIGFGPNTTTNLYQISRALGRGWSSGDRVLVSEACHEANIAPWLELTEKGVKVEFIPMREDTHLDYRWLESHLDRRVRLITFGASSNVTGTLHDIGRVVRAARSCGALVALDAAHYAPHAPLDVKELDVDLCYFSLYKCFGPHQGAFYIRAALCERLSPYAIDGGQPRDSASRFETGTRNHEAFAGWMGTISYLEEMGKSLFASSPKERSRRYWLWQAMSAIRDWEQELTRYGDKLFREVPGLVWYRQPLAHPVPRLGVFSFNCEGLSPESVARILAESDIEGVFGHHGGIRTLKRLAPEYGGASIRLSIAHYTNRSDIERAVDCLIQATTRKGFVSLRTKSAYQSASRGLSPYREAEGPRGFVFLNGKRAGGPRRAESQDRPHASAANGAAKGFVPLYERRSFSSLNGNAPTREFSPLPKSVEANGVSHKNGASLQPPPRRKASRPPSAEVTDYRQMEEHQDERQEYEGVPGKTLEEPAERVLRAANSLKKRA